METLTPDICVIGARRGGLVAAGGAFRRPVVLIEKGEMGGDCLNHGCVPSKTLIASAPSPEHARRRPFRRARNRAAHRVGGGATASRRTIAEIAPMDLRVTRLWACASPAAALADPTPARSRPADFQIRARRFAVIATGSAPAVPAIPGLGTDVRYPERNDFSNSTGRRSACSSLGGGAVGVEMAQAFRRLGCEIVVLEKRRARGSGTGPVALTACARSVDIR